MRSPGAGAIGLGDAVRAYAALAPGDAAASRIAALLGYELRSAPALRLNVGGGDMPTVTRPPTVPEVSVRPVDRPPPAPRSTPSRDRVATHAAERVETWRRVLTPVGRHVPSDVANADLEPLPPEGPAPSTPAEPLLRPSSAHRIVEAMLAQDAGDGDLDVDRVVRTLAERTGLTSIPRLPRLSTLRGVQVLTDTAEAMGPFRRDVDPVVSLLRSTVGAGMVERLSFAGTPLTGAGTGSAWNWSTYRPPPPGTPVLAIAELGLARAPGRSVGELQQSWRHLRGLLGRRGSPLVVLTPFSSRRWPASLADDLVIVEWDRSTTVSSVRRTVRRPRGSVAAR